LIFLTGPTRSGKSRRAVEIAQAWGEGVVFVATYRTDPDDAEMLERVRRHRAERTAAWRMLEAPADIVQALADLRPTPSGAVIDSIVLWLADRLGPASGHCGRRRDRLGTGADGQGGTPLSRSARPARPAHRGAGFGGMADGRRLRRAAEMMARRIAAAGGGLATVETTHARRKSIDDR
jgi:Cobinamide kinase / cobinamide phosphate guanyltransferase